MEDAKTKVAALFGRQEGPASIARLVELGLSRDVVRARVHRGFLAHGPAARRVP